MRWSFLHLKLFIETKANNSVGYTTTKTCVMRHGIPLFLKDCPRVTEVLGCRVSTLCTTIQLIHRFSIGFTYPSLQQPFPDDATSMSWGIDVHEDEIRPVLLTQRHDDWINDVFQVELACHSTIHKVKQTISVTFVTENYCV